MQNFPTIKTSRLVLNRPTENDLEEIIFHLNQTAEFSENTLSMPFPYKEENGRFWLKMVEEGFEKKDAYIFGIREKENLKLIGGIGLHHITEGHHKAEAGYWVAKKFWNKGYASEALQGLMKFGFEELKLNKIYASHFPHNPASGKVLEKCGMKREALLKQEIFKNGTYLDIIRFYILNP